MSFTYSQGTGYNTGSTSYTALFNNPVSSGNLIVVSVNLYTGLGASLTSVVDNYGHTLSQAAFAANSVLSVDTYIHYLVLPSSASSYGVTYNFSSDPYATININEYVCQPNSVVAVYASANTGTGPYPTSLNQTFYGTGLAYFLMYSPSHTGVIFSPFTARNIATNGALTDADILSATSPVMASGYTNVNLSNVTSIVAFVPITKVPNSWVDNFDNLSFNGKLMTARFSDNGSTYSNWQSSNTIVMENGYPYSSLGGSYGAVTSASVLGRNDPVSVTFNYDGGVTPTGYLFIGSRAIGTTQGYYALLTTSAANPTLKFIFDNFGSQTTLCAITPTSFPSGIYTITYAPYNILHSIYMYNSNSGYYNGAKGSWQNSPVTAISLADNNLNATGLPIFGIYMQQAWAHAPQVMQLQGGPQVMMAPNIGVQRASDTFVHVNCFECDGGVLPITYSLQRQITAPSSGNFRTIGYIQPYTPYYDYGVSQSSSYNYRVIATDSSNNTVTSATVSANTLPTQNIIPPTILPGSGTTTVTNGLYITDANGRVMGFTNSFLWDERYQMYFGYPVTSQGTANDSVNCAATADLLNWTIVSTLWPATPGGSNFRNSVIYHPTNGLYYGFNSTTGVIYIYQSTTPYGPFNLIVSGIIPYGVTQAGQTKQLVDYDGSIYIVSDSTGGGLYPGCITQMLPAMTGFVSTTGILLQATEANSLFRYKRLLYSHGSALSNWAPNANTINIWGSQGPGTGDYTLGFTYPNAYIYTTPPQLLSPPAGATGGYNGYTQFGISGGLSYSTQADQVCRTRTGQYIAVTDRWNANGSESITTTSQVWLPINFDSFDQPHIPFVATIVPSSQPQGNAGVHAIGGM